MVSQKPPNDFSGLSTDISKVYGLHLRKFPLAKPNLIKNKRLRSESLIAVLAVANANGMNRIAIIIPCHRVIGAVLKGYGGGIWRKKALLELEEKFKK